MIKYILLAMLSLQTVSLFTQGDHPHLLPQPVRVEWAEGTFDWEANTVFQFHPETEENRSTIRQIRNEYQQGTGGSSHNSFPEAYGTAKTVSFAMDPAGEHPEGYELEIRKDGIFITAATAAGWFYAWQSLKQMFPLTFFAPNQGVEFPFTVPTGHIIDYPRFEYRGMHLDVCRHFFTVEEVKNYIDLLAMHKMNRFHWHLTDDQGWRIEIKKYPRLTETGAWRKETLIGHYNDQPQRFDGQSYGGFYTQEQIREVVEYARHRQVTIIPEIEMPGHALAALAAYPELACTPGPFEVATLWGVFDDVFCPTELTFQFLTDVLTEVAALFPGEYIHIGGDEVPKRRWKESAFCQKRMVEEGLKTEAELQSYFVSRIGQILSGLGKKLIGWDEIMEGGLSPGATVMSWRGIEGGISAARMGHDAIMTPGSHCYFDHYQSDHPAEPVAIGGYTPIEKVYAYEPVPEELNASEAKHILGAQANVWTEYILNYAHVQYMAWPRAAALSEVLWSPAASRDEDRFFSALVKHLHRFDAMGVQYGKQLMDVEIQTSPDASGVLNVTLKHRMGEADIWYTLDGSDPALNGKKYADPVQIVADCLLQAVLCMPDGTFGRVCSQQYSLHKGLGATVEWAFPPDAPYMADGPRSLVNGIFGSDKRYGDGEWLGFSGNDLDAEISWEEPKKISSVSTRFYHGPGQWIHAPVGIELYTEQDDGQWILLRHQDFDPGDQLRVISFSMHFPETEVRNLRLRIKNRGLIPEGFAGAGHGAWLFVDELVFD